MLCFQGFIMSRPLVGQWLISIDLDKPQLLLTASDPAGNMLPEAESIACRIPR